jgi:hypothetical protein
MVMTHLAVKNEAKTLTVEALAALGSPKLVYVREVLAGELSQTVEGLSGLPRDMKLYAVHAADGTPMAIVDNRETAFAGARQNDFEPVSVH